jgi:hypothetical protein
MCVDAAWLDEDVVWPSGVDHLFAREDPAGMLQQMAEQSKFDRVDTNAAAAAVDRAAPRIHLDMRES